MNPEKPSIMAHGQGNAEIVSDGSPSLTCNHEAPIIFEPRYFTRDNKTGGAPDTVATITNCAKAGDSAPVVAFSCKDSGNDAAADVSPTLRSMNSKESNQNGGGQVAIAFPANLSGTQCAASEEVAPVIQAENPTAIAFTQNQVGDVSASMGTNSNASGRNTPKVQYLTAVRRLTPTECLRLQGMPDDWLDGFKFSDTVKYRQIGNSVAVPVFEWVARRIKAHLEIA